MHVNKLPKASSCFLPEPGGLPLFRLEEGSEATPGVPVPPPDSAWTNEFGEEEIGVGDNPNAMLPSGVYFLGLPRFFFAGSILNLIPVEEGGDDPSKRPSEEGGLDCGRGGQTELKGKPAAAVGGMLGLIILIAG